MHDFDAILASRLPEFSEEDAVRFAAATFSVDATTARNLGSERDQTFMMLGADNESLAILKISNAAEDPATLDMEALGVLHARRADPTLPIALPRLVPGKDPGADGAAAYRAHTTGTTGTTSAAGTPGTTSAAGTPGATGAADSHFVRLYDVLPGLGRSGQMGTTTASNRSRTAATAARRCASRMSASIERVRRACWTSHSIVRWALGWENPRRARARRAVISPQSAMAASERFIGSLRPRPGRTS